MSRIRTKRSMFEQIFMNERLTQEENWIWKQEQHFSPHVNQFGRRFFFGFCWNAISKRVFDILVELRFYILLRWFQIEIMSNTHWKHGKKRNESNEIGHLFWILCWFALISTLSTPKKLNVWKQEQLTVWHTRMTVNAFDIWHTLEVTAGTDSNKLARYEMLRKFSKHNLHKKITIFLQILILFNFLQYFCLIYFREESFLIEKR